MTRVHRDGDWENLVTLSVQQFSSEPAGFYSVSVSINFTAVHRIDGLMQNIWLVIFLANTENFNEMVNAWVQCPHKLGAQLLPLSSDRAKPVPYLFW
jgi:hypothetical protein